MPDRSEKIYISSRCANLYFLDKTVSFYYLLSRLLHIGLHIQSKCSRQTPNYERRCDVFEAIFYFFLLGLAVFTGYSVVIYTVYNRMSPLPTSRRVKKGIVDLVRHKGISGRVLELGSGWGTLTIFPFTPSVKF